MIKLPINYHEVDEIFCQIVNQDIRSIAITSSVSGEGVTTLAEALAKRSEASMRRTLLVELNLFKPALSNRFNCPRLNWDYSGQEKATSKFGELSVLPAPIKNESTMKFREKHFLQANLEIWLTDYDLVIFDTSPVNARNRGNIPTELVCSICDATLFVALAAKTDSSTLYAAKNKLSSDDINMIGIVLNDLHNPSLASEMNRELNRFVRFFPKTVEKAKQWLKRSSFINLPV